MISYNDFLALVESAKVSQTVECFLEEYGFPSYCLYYAAANEKQLVEFCNIIWAAAHMDIAKMIEISTNGNLTAFSQRFDIPRRTVQNWKAGVKPPKEYVVSLIAYVVVMEIKRNNIEKRGLK